MSSTRWRLRRPAHRPKPRRSASVIDQLERLGHLREQNLITEEEFTAAKAKILGA